MSPSDPRPLLCFFNDSPWSSSLEETVPDQVEVNKLTLLHPHHKQLGLNNNNKTENPSKDALPKTDDSTYPDKGT